MSFSAAASFDPNVGTPATPAPPAAGGPAGLGFYSGEGKAYTDPVQAMYADPGNGAQETAQQVLDSYNTANAAYAPITDPSQAYGNSTYSSAPTYLGNPTDPNALAPQLSTYDTSKYSGPNASQLAYIDSGMGSTHGQGWGPGGSQGLSPIIQQLGLDPNAFIKALDGQSYDKQWLTPASALQVAARGYAGPNSDALNSFINSHDFLQTANDQTTASNDAWQSIHPRSSMTGMDYFTDIVLPAVTMGLGAVGGAGAMLAGDAAIPEAGISSGMAEMFPEAGASFAGPGATFTAGQAIQNAGEALAKKLAMQALTKQKTNSDNFDPTGYIKPAGDIISTFADGGSVDDFSFDSPDTNDYSAPPSDLSLPSVDPSSFVGPSDTALSAPSDWSSYLAPSGGGGGLSMGMVGPQAMVNDPENQGTMGNMSGYDKTAPSSPNSPSASDAHMPASATGASQGVIGAALQKLGYLNDKGDVNLGAALKAGATIASLAVTYLNNKKLASSGAQLAAAQVQPGQVFTLPNSALSNYQGAPYATGRPTNSNSVVSLRAHGGLMQHHLAMGGSPLGAPTGAMPPAMLPQGGMNRMPGASPQGPGGMPPPPGGMGGNPQAQPPQMPMGGMPAWQGVAPPPSAVPAPVNHFAHGGALSMVHNYQGHGAVRGPGGGQDDIVDARMAPGEYVFDADTVAALGDGSSEEGARRLDAWRKHLREHKRSAPSSKIPPKALPAPHYLGGKT